MILGRGRGEKMQDMWIRNRGVGTCVGGMQRVVRGRGGELAGSGGED